MYYFAELLLNFHKSGINICLCYFFFVNLQRILWGRIFDNPKQPRNNHDKTPIEWQKIEYIIKKSTI